MDGGTGRGWYRAKADEDVDVDDDDNNGGAAVEEDMGGGRRSGEGGEEKQKMTRRKKNEKKFEFFCPRSFMPQEFALTCLL